MKQANYWMGILLLVLAGFAEAAVCTSLSAGRWDQAARWSCGRIPLATDTVVIAHNNVQMRGNYTVAGLTVNAGAVLDGNNMNLTVNGAVAINGTYNTNGGNLTTTGGGALAVNTGGVFDFNGGAAVINGNVVINGILSSGGDDIRMTGASTTLSGTGNVVNTTIEIDAAGVSVPVGTNLKFDANSAINVAANVSTASLTINGTIDGTAQAVGDRIIRVSTGGSLTVGSTGVINAPNSQLNVRTGASATNNGTITIGELIGRTGAPVPVFTQGVNSTLNISIAVCSAANPCTFNASAAGNTVNYNGAAQTVKLPSGAPATYYHLTLSGSGIKTMPATAMTVAGDFAMSGSATATAAAALTVGDNFSINASGAFNNSTFALNVAGDFAQNGTFTAGTGVVTLNGASAQTISGTGPLGFANLTDSNTGGITLARNVTVISAIIGAVTLTSTCPTDYTLTSNGGATVAHSCSTSVINSINRANPSPTSAASVSWTVIFNMSVSGVSSSNFTLVNSGLGGTPAITLVSGSGTTWTVTASTGTGSGTLGLNMSSTTGVIPSVANLPFTGQVYVIGGAMGSGVINTYYPSAASVAAGATSITLGAATGATTTPIAIGDLLLIMQMQDATIDSSNTATYGTVSAANAGLYEYAIAASNVPTGGGTLTLSCATINAYTNANYVAGSSGQRRYQVIRVPVYASATLNSALTALAWNGSTGGVLAFDVTGVLTLNSATVTVDGLGFRGGASRLLAGPGATGTNTDYRTLATVNNNASKGEGIAGTPYYVLTAPSTLTNTGIEGYPNGSHARGAPANGGGGGTDGSPTDNQENTGGGGGANGGSGGKGGIGWCGAFNALSPPNYNCSNSGGLGGYAVTGLGATRLTLGGGGGGATTNNGTGTPAAGLASSGAAGGGIIMLRAGSMTGAATFNANGNNGDSTVGNDGSGGGGAGGVVLISAASGMGGVTINVKGGNGGTNLIPPLSSGPHGPGGGGGGGYAITTGVPATSNVAAGTSGVTYNNGVLFGAYGATAGSAGSLNSGLTATVIPGVALGATSCAGTDHFQISHGGTGVNCQAEPVTFSAHNAAHGAFTLTAGTVVDITTSTGNGDWSLSSGAGVLVNNGNGSATYTSGAENGFVLNLKDTFAETTNINLVSGSATELGGTASADVPYDPDLAFAPSGFRFVDASDVETIINQVAGVESAAYYLQAIRTDTRTGACVNVFANNVDVPNIELASECINPSACQAGEAVTITNNAVPTPIAGNTGGSVTAYTSRTMRFGINSKAAFTFNYSDVGKIKLHARYYIPRDTTPPSLSGNYMAGTTKLPDTTIISGSNEFVVKPDHFDLSGIQQTAAPNLVNPAATDAAGNKFVMAGEQFSVIVTAKNALGNTTKNYGQETTAESVKLTSALAGGLGLTNNPAIGGTFSLFTNGVATSTAFTWNEVGIIKLTPSVGDADYLGAGDTSGTQSGDVGRFYAAKFALTPSPIANRTGLGGVCAAPAGCGTFTYMGEQMSAVFTLTAKAADGTTTLQNYTYSATPANNFAKLDPTAAGNPLALAAVDTGMPRTVATLDTTTYGATSGNFVSGDTTVTVPFAVARGGSASGPFDALEVGVNPADSDGAALAILDLAVNAGGTPNTHGKIGTTKARYGRMKLSNAHGSELLPLPINVTAQYWNGATYVTNTLDNNSTFAATAVTFVSYTTPLSAANYPNSGSTSVTPASVVFTNGVAGYKLAKPGAGNNGSVDMTVNVLSAYLPPGNTGRATFGVYKGNNEFIYLRENY